MNTITIQSTASQQVAGQTTPGGVSETALEQTVGVSLLADFNDQLSSMAKSMQNQLDTRKNIQSDLTELQGFNTRTAVDDGTGPTLVVTGAEKATLLSQYPTLVFKDQNGVPHLTQSSLQSVIADKQENLAGLNSSGEMMSLQIQSLVEQRKNAITMLSNLIASRSDTLGTIIRNLKN